MFIIYTCRTMNPLERLRQCKGFDWDEGNSGKNFEKHGVSDSEAEQLFFNQPLIGAPDEKHSDTEERVHALGQTDAGKKLFVVCTIRGELLRVISARPMSRREREVYESYEQEA
jgi:hypothetical protein